MKKSALRLVLYSKEIAGLLRKMMMIMMMIMMMMMKMTRKS